jgi:hypothetical protein
MSVAFRIVCILLVRIDPILTDLLYCHDVLIIP